MKYTLIYFSCIFYIVSCKGNPKANHPSSKNNTEVNTANTDSIQNRTNFPINEIIKNSIVRKFYYDLSKPLNFKFKKISSEIIKKYLVNYSIDNLDNQKIEYDKYARYYYFDFSEFKDYTLFTIIYDDEIGYQHYLNYTYSKKLDSITSVSLIASKGGDGGHWQEEHLYYTANGMKLKTITNSYFDEDIFNETLPICYSRSFDSIISNFQFKEDKTTYKSKTVFNSIDTIYSSNN